MKIVATIDSTRAATRAPRRQGQRVGLVPTMGALHEGHLSLVRAAKAQSDYVVVSLFVNPLQFGPNEDLAKYPRTWDRDRDLLEQAGVDLLFAPTNAEMYPDRATTFVNVEGLSERLDGQSRPGHFRGVTTVVSKLFHIVEPDRAFFGQKDAAQVAIMRRMVRDLNLPVEIVVCPIVREPDGLAMSSRNAYLSPEDRERAMALSRALRAAEERVRAADGLPAAIEAARAELEAAGVEPEYLEARDPDDLTLVEALDDRPVLLAVAARIGGARLIDNVLIQP